LALLPAGPSAAQVADPTDNSLRIYAVHVGGLYGVYLGNGLVITAAHVVGANPRVWMAGRDLPAEILKRSPFEQLDLALLSVDPEQLPISLRLRRMPLCTRPLFVGAPVIIAIPEQIARSQIISPLRLPPDTRKRFATAIKDVATTGNSGSGVFDAQWKCLLGIMSRKIVAKLADGKTKDIAKYFVPAATIRAFVPADARF
jgi:hypothetical protein